MKIAMAAGGTGGHIYPALTLAEALKERGHEVVFFGSRDRMESEIIPKSEFTFIPLDIVSTQGNVLTKIKSLLSLNKAYARCKRLLDGYDMVIGFGNYISIPVIMAGKSRGLKTVIHEQNSFVGKANKYLDTKVDLVIGSYKEDKEQFKNPNTLILGNPQGYRALRIKEEKKVIEDLGLDPNKKTVVIFMGSLGSETVNKIMLDYFNLTDGSYQIVYATGKSYYKEDIEKLPKRDYIKVFERIDGIRVMKASDLLISRAGATTLCEIIATGMPSLLIPSPYVPNNHQYYNAKSLVDNGAALMIEEKDLTCEKLNEMVNSIINNEATLKNLSLNARKMSNDSVLEDIVKEIEKI